MELLSLKDVEARLKLVLSYFDTDAAEFTIHLSKYLDKYGAEAALRAKTSGEQQDQKSVAAEKKAKEGIKLVTDMSNLGVLKSLVESADVENKQDGASALQQAVISPGSDLIEMLLASGGISGTPITESKNWNEVKVAKVDQSVVESVLHTAQKMRRRDSILAIEKKITSGDGRKLSSIEKNKVVIDEAIKLATTEEIEEAQLEEEEDEEEEEFFPGQDVVIIEGDNVGLFGVLQAEGDAIKTDYESNYGVDVIMEDGTIEGYWIHPEALQHKKFIAGDRVSVIDGLNAGRTGTIQVDGKRLRFDNGSYGVDVDVDDEIEGFWVYPKSMKFLKPERQKQWEEEREVPELVSDNEQDWEFLPYIPYPNDDVEKILGEALNTFEIDVNIKRLTVGKGKIVYRFGNPSKLNKVRCVHGVLLTKQGKQWVELIPLLRKLAGMAPAEEKE
jgi:hypothetical protein